VEWLKTQLALAKSGERSARKKLIVTAVLLVTVLVLIFTGQSSSEPVVVAAKTSKDVASVGSGYIHISGAVVHPGVYAIDSGARLFEIIALAGGFTKSADQSSVNLARVVVDGEQVLIASDGEQAVSDSLIHINRATAAELDVLPGIGPTLSQRIVDWREANGSFKSIEDLRSVAGIGDRLFAGIRNLVVL
jgi:competence protein ComEA